MVDVVRLLADLTVARSTIGSRHDNVVCPSVTDDVYLLWCSGSVYGVESCTVVFLGWDFLLTSSDTFAVGCIIYPQTAQTVPGTKSRLQFSKR